MDRSAESLIQDVITAYDHEMNQWKDLRTSSEHNYDYYRGNQWVKYPEEKAKLDKLGVPTLSYNQILPIIILILGYQIQHGYNQKAYPIRGTSQYLAELMTRLLKYTYNKSDISYELSQVALDALLANIGGYATIDWTNEFDPFGEFRIRRESPFYHLRDSSNDNYDINKGNHHLRTMWLTDKELKAMYPDRASEIKSYTNYKSKRIWSDIFTDVFKKVTKSSEPSKFDYIDEKNGRYRVVELWKMETKERNVILNLQNNNIMEYPEKMTPQVRKLVKLRNNLELTKIKTRELKVTTTLGGTELLVDNQKYDIQVGKFPFVNFFTYWIDGEPLSNAENLKDYQDEHNKRTNNILYMLNSTANSGWWVKKFGNNELSVDMEDLIVNGSKIGFIGQYKGSQPPEKIKPNDIPRGHIYMDEQTKSGIRETSGVNNNIRGAMESTNESGKLFQNRVAQNERTLEPYFINVKKSYQLIGEYLLAAIPKMYTEQRVFEIAVEDDNIEQFEINSNVLTDITSGNYSLTLKEVDDSPTAKTQKFMEMVGMVNMMPPELVHWPSIIMQSPYEGKEKMAQYAEQVMGMQQETQGRSQDLAEAKALSEMQGAIVPKGAKKAVEDEAYVNG